MKNKLKNEKGSITLFVLISMLFFVIVLGGIYITTTNRIQKQNSEVSKIEQSYQTYDADELYDRAIGKGNRIPVDSTRTLAQALQEAEPRDTIVLNEDVAVNSLITLDKEVVIDANNHKINSSAGNVAISLETDKKVVIKNAEISGTNRGIAINTESQNLVIENTVFNVSQRGITVNTDSNEGNITIKDSVIQNSRVAGNENSYVSSDTRGISLWEYSNSTITLENTEINGFSYVINISGDSDYEYENATINIKNCTLRGRAGLNIWSYGATINIEDCNIIGLNNQGGSQETFSDIVINQVSGNTLNIKNTAFSNYQNATGLANQNAKQYMLGVRGTNNNINISGNTSFTDTTGKLTTILENESIVSPTNKINITGGSYSYSVSQFIDETKYKQEEQDGRFIISPK